MIYCKAMAVVESFPGHEPTRESPLAVPPFDPYYKWLGIPPDDQPPNHYRLLGIRDFEADPDVIANAADARMAHLRSFANGPNSALSQKLLNEVSAARVCLLHPQKKAEYDTRLRPPAVQEISAPPLVAPPSADFAFLEEEPLQAPRPRMARMAQKRPSEMMAWLRRHAKVVLGGMAASITAGAATLFVVGNDRRDLPETPRKPAQRTLPADAPELRQGAMPIEGTDDVREKVAAVVSPRDNGPFRDFPAQIELPQIPMPLDAADEPPAAALAKIRTDAETEWWLSLEGAPEGVFLRRVSTSEDPGNIVDPKDSTGAPLPTWNISFRDPSSPSASQPIAVLTRRDDELQFAWHPQSTQALADLLDQCGLKVILSSNGEVKVDLPARSVRLRMPLSLQPVPQPVAPPPEETPPLPIPPPSPFTMPADLPPSPLPPESPSPPLPVKKSPPKPARRPLSRDAQREEGKIDLLQNMWEMNAQKFHSCIREGKVQLHRGNGSMPSHLELWGANLSYIYLPEKIRGSYQYSVRFVRTAGNESVEFDLPVGSSMTTMVLSGWRGEAGGFSRVDGRDANDQNNPTRIAPCTLQNGMEYQLDVDVTVRNMQDAEWATVSVYLSEPRGRRIPICQFAGRTASLTMNRFRVQNTQGFGFSSISDANSLSILSAQAKPTPSGTRKR